MVARRPVLLDQPDHQAPLRPRLLVPHLRPPGHHLRGPGLRLLKMSRPSVVVCEGCGSTVPVAHRGKVPRWCAACRRRRRKSRRSHRAGEVLTYSCADCKAELTWVVGPSKPRRRCAECARLCAKQRKYAARRLQRRNGGRREERIQHERRKRLRIYERDGWVCHLCGTATIPGLAGTRASLAPTLDHLVTVTMCKALGWTNAQMNADSNLATAHWYCNCIVRRDQPLPFRCSPPPEVVGA